MLGGKAENTNLIGFGLNRPEIEPTIYSTRDKYSNHYTTDVVYSKLLSIDYDNNF